MMHISHKFVIGMIIVSTLPCTPVGPKKQAASSSTTENEEYRRKIRSLTQLIDRLSGPEAHNFHRPAQTITARGTRILIDQYLDQAGYFALLYNAIHQDRSVVNPLICHVIDRVYTKYVNNNLF